MSRRDDEHADYPVGGRRRQRGEGADGLQDDALETPVDLAAVQADDALLDMLGGAGSLLGGGDADLGRVLVAWRRDVDAQPIGELVDTDTAMAVISAARRPAPRRHPLLAPFAAAAAVLVIAFSGVGLVAKSAEPGDRLWALTKVLYADYARSTEAVVTVRNELTEAQTALRQGDTQQAKESLRQAEDKLEEIQESQEKTELATERKLLEQKLDGMPPTTPEPDASPATVSPPSATTAPPTSEPTSAPPDTSTPAEPSNTSETSAPAPTSAPTSTPTSPATDLGSPSPGPRTLPDGSSTVAPTPSS